MLLFGWENDCDNREVMVTMEVLFSQHMFP
jgi:hypothetical protein